MYSTPEPQSESLAFDSRLKQLFFYLTDGLFLHNLIHKLCYRLKFNLICFLKHSRKELICCWYWWQNYRLASCTLIFVSCFSLRKVKIKSLDMQGVYLLSKTIQVAFEWYCSRSCFLKAWVRCWVDYFAFKYISKMKNNEKYIDVWVTILALITIIPGYIITINKGIKFLIP